MICDSCGKNVNIIRTIDKKGLCDRCSYEVKPPILLLTVLQEEPGMLFNPKIGKFEQDVEKMKNLCGFYLYSHKTFRPPYDTSEKHKQILTFKYRGTYRCHKFPEYKSWPVDMPPCRFFPNKAPLCMHRITP